MGFFGQSKTSARHSEQQSNPQLTYGLSIEQSLVIIMGNIPPLRAFPRHQFRSFGSTFSFLRSWGTRSTPGQDAATSDTPKSDGRAYQDLELQSQKIQQIPRFVFDSSTQLNDPKNVFPIKDNSSMGSYGDSKIVRNDIYEVSYEAQKKSTGAI
jgi:hypothetical protein